MRQITVTDTFLHDLNVEVYDEVKDPKSVVLIVHGINEHARRYLEFCEFLNTQNYIAIVYDQFSQGYSRKEHEEYVDFTRNGVHILVNGLESVISYIKETYKGLPLFGLGHSMGTMILRYYLQTHKCPFTKVIYNGGGYQEIKNLWIGLLVGRFIQLFRAKKPTQFFDNIFRQTQTKIIEKVEIDHFIEWLTSDEEKTESNKKDPFLFIRLTTNTYMVNLKMIQHINSLKNIETTNLDCDILLLSGSHDPATNFGAATKDLHELYQELGIQSQYKIYDKGRHDTLQETFRLDVFNDIVGFLGGK